MSQPRRILVVRTDRLGDVILTLPMLALLRSRYPNVYLGMLLSRYTGEIVRNHPHVNVLLWNDEAGQPRPAVDIIREIRAQEFDTVFLVHPTPRLAWIMARTRIPVRIGTGYRYYSVLLTHRVFEHRKDARHHELEYNLRLLSVLDPSLSVDGVRPEFGIVLPPGAVRTVDGLLSEKGVASGESFAVLHPGSGGSARDWPVERFGALGQKLAKERGVRVIVTGGRGEEEYVARVAAAAGDPAIPLCGVLTLPELGALYARASLVVANSTGPLHLAAALGTPVVGIYPQLTPMSPARWGPYTDKKRVLVPDAPADCRLCRNGERCVCLESITVDQVYEASLSFLTRPGGEEKQEGMYG